jgi:hypothetical protein
MRKKRTKATIEISGDTDLSKLAVSLGSFSPSTALLGDFKMIKCPDGTPVAIIRDLDKAFPRFAADWTATVGGTVSRLKGIAAKVGIDVRKRVVNIYDSLDRISGDLAQNYRTNYTEFAARPCDEKSTEILRKANESVRKATFILRALQLEAERDTPDIERMELYLSQLASEVGSKVQT